MVTRSSAAPRTGIEQAIASVRLLLALLGAITVAAVGISSGRILMALAVAGAIGVAAAAVTAAAVYLDSDRGRERTRHGRRWVHILDTLLFVAFVVALETYVTGAAWTLLVIPIVAAALRLNDVAVLGTWVMASATYALAGQVDLVSDSGDAELLLERAGVLLAVAASVALLTRWLQEGWVAQGELTAAAETRTGRLGIVEQAGRAMRSADHDEVVEVCMAHVPGLGFHAATVDRRDGKRLTAGNGDIVPQDAIDGPPEPGRVDVTCWLGEDGAQVTSASVFEPISRTTITGWIAGDIDDAMAQALHELVANATLALEAAHHLRRARFAASHDPLTGLANRASFREQLDSAAEGNGLVAVFFIDLDHFKEVNDTHGHLMGDNVLVALASRLERAVGRHGVVARFGGDEFIVLVTGDVVDHAAELGEHIRWALGYPFSIKSATIDVTASVGVAVGNAPLDPGRLIQRADQAAYAAKDSGRNRVEEAALPPTEEDDGTEQRLGPVAHHEDGRELRFG